MIEKFFYIDEETSRKLLSETKAMKPSARGFEKHTYLIGSYAVLTASRLKLRNVTTRDDDLAYYDELINTLMVLYNNGVSVVPVLGYCYDPDSENGIGYIIQPRAKGDELYNDAIMKAFYIWATKNPENVYFYSNNTDAKDYILSRTELISKVPQEHYDKFVEDIMILNKNDILIDFIGKSNFFYDETCGFQFIDLDSHTDFKHGLCDSKDNDNLGALLGCFTPCHLALGTQAFSKIALDDTATQKFKKEEAQKLIHDNMLIFEKCKHAVQNSGYSDGQINHALTYLKIYGGKENE